MIFAACSCEINCPKRKYFADGTNTQLNRDMPEMPKKENKRAFLPKVGK
jgi:hypothetical protein